MQDTFPLLREAIARHQAADHTVAAALYRTVLDAEPRHPRALYLYGLLLLDTGRSKDATATLTLAAEARPGDAAVLTLPGDWRPVAAEVAGGLADWRDARDA